MLNFLKNLFGGGNADNDIDDNTPGPKNKNLSGAQFKEQLLATPEAVLIDVRTAAEVSGGKLPKAIHIDFMSPSFAQKAGQLDKNKTYFLYCRSGNRSGQACSIMHRMGYNVRNLNGGIGAFPK